MFFTGAKWRHLTGSLALSCFCCFLSAMWFGYMIGFTSLALTQMGDLLDDVTGSWFASLAPLGAAAGSLIGGQSVDRLGRRLTLILAGLPGFIGWSLLALSGSVGWLLMGRFLTGLATGILQVACWTYVAEVSPTDLRGVLGTGVQLMLTVGVLAAFLLGLVAEWRLMAAIGAGIPVLYTLLMIRVPDTPRFYLKTGQREMALRSLTWLRRPSHNVILECSEIEAVVNQERESPSWSWSDVMRPELYRPFRICLVVKLLQHATGIDAVKMYTVEIFQSVGFSEGYESRLAAVAIGATTTAATLAAANVMDLFGRRKLLLISGAGTAVTCFTLGLSFLGSSSVETETSLRAIHPYLALGSLILYCVFFGLGYGPVPMLVTSELLPVRGKGVVTSWISVLGWLAAFAVTRAFSPLQGALGPHGAFWSFSVLCIFGCCYVNRHVPETKGRSLEDIELSFHTVMPDEKS